MTINVTPYLDDLAARIDEAQELANRQAWIDFAEDRCEQNVFVPPARKPAPPRIEWPRIGVNAAMDDQNAMILHQFGLVSKVLAAGIGPRLNVRCNYGTGIGSTLFGCELFMMDAAIDTLPTSKPLGEEHIAPLLAAGMPSLRRGLGAKVFDMAERYMEIFEKYPVLRRNVELYHPDMQGPIDIAELIWGSEIFYAFYDAAETLRQFLDLITHTYIAFMREWYALVGSPGQYSAHWGLTHKGSLMIRNDSLMNLSPEIYVEFVRPLDQKAFDRLGGGAIHFCGRGDHFIEAMSQMHGLTAIQLSQPEYNNMETIYQHTVDKGLPLIGFNAEVAKNTQRPLRGRVQVAGWSS